MDYEAIVAQKLLPGHKLIVAAEAGLVLEFRKTARIVALIEGLEPGSSIIPPILPGHFTSSPSMKRRGDIVTGSRGEVERALLVLRCSCRLPPVISSDLTIEAVLPVDARFQYTIDGHSTKQSITTSGAGKALEKAVLLSFTSAHHKLLFEMSFSQRTNTFVSEVLRAAEGVSKRKAPTPEFTWLRPYTLSSGASSTCGLDSKQAPFLGPAVGGMSQSSDGIFTIDGGNAGKSPVVMRRSFDDGLSESGNRNLADNRVLSPTDVNFLSIDNASVVNSYADSAKFYEASPTPIAARESHVQHQMSLRESSYTHNTPLNVFVGTWNVNGVPPSVGLAGWLSSDQTPPDVYALGFQELDLATEAYIFSASPREQEWRSAVLMGVHPAGRYREVTFVRLVGVLLIVLVHEKHARHVTNVQTCVVPTGIMNMLGNKGGVSARLNLYNTSVCFVNCHLAAHVDEFERRNEDYDCICEKTVFAASPASGQPARYIRDHNHIYFFGDMNYRIPPAPDLDICKYASNSQFKPLLDLDQLNLQKRVGRVFKGYLEGEITFKPTYKYDRDTDIWDSSEKGRQPAWCDRILWAGEGIEQLAYRSHMALRISDHKPVSAVFKSQVKVVDLASYRRIHEEVMKQLDRLENEFLPAVSLSTTEIILEQPVRFLEPQRAKLTISNTGQIPVQFAFIKKLSDEACCKPWLKIHPMTAFIIPGADCEVLLEVKVDKRSASSLNNGTDKLYDILVLHLEGGKDFFITVTGDYERSCFGTSINALVHLNKPFSEVPVAQLVDLESSTPKNGLELPYAMPKELWFLVDHLHTHGQLAEGLFSRAGLNKEILEIRACLDAGVPSRSLPGSVYSVAETLVLLLEALPEPVVPYALYPHAMAASASFAGAKVIMDRMPDYHRNVFNYLMAFLKELLAHRDQNRLDESTLAMVFGMILLREHPSAKKLMTTASSKADDSKKKQSFVLHFLVNEY